MEFKKNTNEIDSDSDSDTGSNCIEECQPAKPNKKNRRSRPFPTKKQNPKTYKNQKFTVTHHKKSNSTDLTPRGKKAGKTITIPTPSNSSPQTKEPRRYHVFSPTPNEDSIYIG